MCRSQLLKWVGCTLLVLQGFAWAEDGMVSNLSDTSNVTPRSAVVETTVLGDTTAAPAQVETTRAATSDSLAGAQSNEKAETGGTAQKELKGTASRLEDMFSPGKILAAVVIFLAAYLIIRILMFVLTVLGERVSQHRLKFMKLIPIVRISTWLLAVHLAIVEVFQPSTEALLAFTASAGIAIGFASQYFRWNYHYIGSAVPGGRQDSGGQPLRRSCEYWAPHCSDCNGGRFSGVYPKF